LFRCYGNGSRAFLLSIYLAVTSRQIFRGRVYAVTSPFPSNTPHVPAKPKTLSRQKGKAVPLQTWSGPEGSRKLRFPDFMTTAQDDGKFVRLTHRPALPPGNTPGTHFC
jgi:hypothetical protein